jgi:hypothetical protein
MSHGVLIPAALEAAANRLAVDGHQPPDRQFDHRRHPRQEAAFKGVGVQQREDSAEGVMRRNAALEVQEGREPLEFALAPELHLHPAVGPADDRHDCDHQQVVQFMNGVVAPRVRQVRKKAQKTTARTGVHAKLPRKKPKLLKTASSREQNARISNGNQARAPGRQNSKYPSDKMR